MKKIICFLSTCLFLSSTSLIARDYISIVGSSTVYPFATLVAEKLASEGMKAPVIESTGSGGGHKLFCAGIGVEHPDITNSSRAQKDKEFQLCKENGVTDIIEVRVGNDGIAFAYSADYDYGDINLTKEQIWQAMAKDNKNAPKTWSDIDAGLPNVEISIMAPPPTSGTRDAWNSLVMVKGCTKAAKSLHEANGKKAKKECAKMREDGYAVEAGENDTLIVQKLAANPDAYGFFGYSYLLANKDKIKAAAVNGVKPSLEGIQDYSYPIARPLFFYVKKAHVGVVPGLKEFLDEFTSKKAMGSRGYLTDIGLVPLASDKYKITRTAAKDLVTIKLN